MRTRIICLKNDLKDVLEQVQLQLLSSLSTGDDEKESISVQDSDIPFAQILKVFPSSPAAEAGLLVGDKIVMFDNINVSNHGNLKELARVVQLKEDVCIVTVKLRLTPDSVQSQ